MTDTPYDHIIVGAGSAGCVLAGRLSLDSRCRVLLLEAGGSDAKMEVRIPAAFTKLFRTDCDWSYDTVPQQALNNRALYWPRGRMLGGSSSMNAQMWVRGHRADYDSWAAHCGPDWSWATAARAFARAERHAGAPAELYGRDGPLHVERQRDPNVTTGAFLQACRELGLRELSDLNEPDNLGFACTPVTQRRGRRWSAADAYLEPAKRRKNLSLVTGAGARRVLIEQGVARGIEYVDRKGRVQQAFGREIVLAAGAVNSPQLLMVSGIGPADHLTEHGIPVVHDSPDVGANLQDHLVTAVIVAAQKPVTLVAAESIGNLFKYLLLGRGMLTSCVGEAVAFVRTREELSAPDIELIWAPVPYMDHGQVKPPGHGLTVGVVLLQPESRGTIRLRSRDPAQPPLIDPRYFSDPEGQDVRIACAGIRFAQRLLATRALAAYVGAPIEPAGDVSDDADLRAFIREQAETLYHPVGTCRMGKDPASVVDPELRVRGVAGLRVVDASVIPRINRGHTNAPTIMIAERAAELMTK